MMSVTERVIREQFPFWTAALARDDLPLLGARVVVTGCGTSYYLAQTIAVALNQAGRQAFAVPAAEWTDRPGSYLPYAAGWTVLGLSRSGTTTETVAAIRESRARGLATVALTCAPESEITLAAAQSAYLPTHADEGIVMSVSASLMLLAGLRMAGVALPPDLPEQAEAVMQALDQQGAKVWKRRHFAYLGGGGLYGLACEGALKLMEMSITPAQAFHPLEYRHGPISLIDGDAAVVTLYSRATAEAEAAVVRDVEAKGALTLGFGGPGRLTFETGPGDFAAGLAALPSLQLIGERVAQAKKVDTTAPRHLTKVVVLT